MNTSKKYALDNRISLSVLKNTVAKAME